MGKLLQKLKGGKKKKHQNDVDELEWLDFDEDEEYEDDDDGYEDEEEYEDDEYADDEEEYEDDEYADEYVEEEYEDDEYADDEEEYEDDEYADDEEEYEDGEYADDEEEYEDDGYADEEEEYEDDEYADEDDEYEDDEYYEDEEYDEDDEYYEDDEYDDEEYDDEDEDIPESGIKKILYKITNMSTVDYVVAMTGVAVLVLAVVTGTLYFGARSSKAQVEAFAEVGEGMESIQIIGQSGLMAIADAQASRMAAADIEEEEGEDSEEEETNGEKEVVLNLTSIQKDLKIKFVEKKSGKLVSGIDFAVDIEKPSGETYSKKDDDKDGIIYEKDIAPGKYKVKITSPSSNDEFGISGETVAITVRDAIEYKKVDVSDEVKTESQVNAAAEDTKVNETVVESSNKDTNGASDSSWRELGTILVIDDVIPGIRQALQSRFARSKNTRQVRGAIRSQVIVELEKKAAAEFRLLAGVNDNVRTEGDLDNSDTGNNNGDNTGSGNEPDTDKTPEPEEPKDPTPEPEEPKETPKPTETPEPTAEPVPTATVPATAPPTSVPTATPTAAATATPTGKPTATPTAKPSVTPTAKPSATPTATPGGARTDTKTTLKSTDGEILYVKESDGKFREAKYADYYKIKEFYRKVSKTTGKYKYTGWQEIDGKTYFFDKNGNPVTGEQVIQGAKYNFNSDGSLNTGSGHLGIDVSKWNGSIDWNAVKSSGVSFVIIRCGYRGALIEDPMFRSNIQGATKAGLKVGVYFFTQAVNEVEAVEEASMAVGLIKGYNISYPVFLDVESSNGGRGDGISAATRTAVCKAFCQTVQNSGYKAGIYANKTWFTTHIDTPSLTGYKIWLAQYAAAPSYNRTKYDMWQYSSKGRISGISTDVDMNISYMGY